LFGLVVAITVQFLYNWATSKIDKLIIDMEESAVALVDILVEMKR